MTQAVGHIAPIPSKSHLTRRAALTGMALIAAPSTALADCVEPDGQHPIDALWLKRRELRRRSAAVSASYKAASDALPDWAAEGHEFIRKSDGEGFGCNCGWPALEAPLDAGDHLIVRLNPVQITHWGAKRPRAEYRAAMRDFVKRRRDQQRVRDEVGLTFLDNESERLVNETIAVEEEIVRIADASHDLKSAAAHCIISLSHSFTGGEGFGIFEGGAAALLALRAIRPLLSGALAEDADEVLSKNRICSDQVDDEA